jgi:hypothetical protein
MNISLDYDNTYTRDPKFWDDFVKIAKMSGHNVYCVTMRSVQESVDVLVDLDGKVDGIYFTDRKAKSDFMFSQGISIDVWVDDMPFFVNNDAKG